MKQIRRFAAFVAIVLLVLMFGISWLFVARAGRDSSGVGGVGVATATASALTGSPVLVGAGDIAVCGSRGAEATARLLDVISGTVFVAGDAAYGSGTARQFRDCYGPTWGRHKERTRPAPGNHEYNTKGAVPYFEYFGENAGEAGKGYYSYDLGAWHIIALNSNIPAGRGSEQMKWLRADLAASKAICTLAYWHHPLFSSGQHGNEYAMLEAWRVLYEHRADVVLNGHDHSYERFGPQTPQGKGDPGRGIREFVVGTGGAHLRGFGRIKANSEVRNSDTWGVLKLTLHPESYDWEFVPVAGKSFRDSGSAACVR